MALVDPRLLERLQPPHQPKNMVQDTMSELDLNMKTILERNNVPPQQKVTLYNDYLKKYMLMNQKLEQPTAQELTVQLEPTPQQEPAVQQAASQGLATQQAAKQHVLGPLEMEIIANTPKAYKQKAAVLIQRLKQDKHMDWNQHGELVYKGKHIPETHIHDLVQDVLRKRKTHNPKGWKIFAQALKEGHVPQDLIGNEDRWQFMQGTEIQPSSQPLVSSSPLEQRKIIKRKRKALKWTPYNARDKD